MADNYRSLAEIMKGKAAVATTGEDRPKRGLYSGEGTVNVASEPIDLVAPEPVVAKPVPVMPQGSPVEALLRNSQEVIEQPIQQVPLTKQDIRNRDVQDARAKSAEMTNSIDQLLKGQTKVAPSEQTVETPTLREEKSGGMPDWVAIMLGGLAGGVAGGGGSGLTEGAGVAADSIRDYRKEKIAAASGAAKAEQEKAKLDQAAEFKQSELMMKKYGIDTGYEKAIKGYDARRDVNIYTQGAMGERQEKKITSTEKMAEAKIDLSQSRLDFDKVKNFTDLDYKKTRDTNKEQLIRDLQDGKITQLEADRGFKYLKHNDDIRFKYTDMERRVDEFTKTLANRKDEFGVDTMQKGQIYDLNFKEFKEKAKMNEFMRGFDNKQLAQAYGIHQGKLSQIDRHFLRKEATRKEEQAVSGTQFDRTLEHKDRGLNETIRHSKVSETQKAINADRDWEIDNKRYKLDVSKYKSDISYKDKVMVYNELVRKDKNFNTRAALEFKRMESKAKLSAEKAEGLTVPEKKLIFDRQGNFRKINSRAIDSLESTERAISLLNDPTLTGNDIINNLISFELAKSANGGGRLTDQDVANFRDGDKTLQQQIKEIYSKYADTGTITDKSRQLLKDVVVAMNKTARGRLATASKNYAKDTSSILKFSDKFTADDYASSLFHMPKEQKGGSSSDEFSGVSTEDLKKMMEE